MKQIVTENDALEYLNESGGEPLDMTRMALLAGLEGRLPYLSLHVAGTNGKGSVCAFAHAILTAAGYRTGLFTSPHLVSFHERIRVDDKPVSAQGLARCAQFVQAREAQLGLHPPPFARFTAAALEWFRLQKVDAAVFEVGLGGLKDPTNVIVPDAAVITAVGFDHTDNLGDTLEKIAVQKCGIIKPGCTIVSHPQHPRVMEIIREICRQRRALLFESSGCRLEPLSASLDGQSFSLETPSGVFPRLQTGLAGTHQLDNARSAVLAVQALRKKGADISDAAILKGVRRAQWPCRMQVVRRKPLVILDGAHNESAAEALGCAVRSLLPGVDVTLIAGIFRDKDAAGFARHMGFASRAIAVTPPDARGLEAEAFARCLELHVPHVVTAASTAEAMELALRRAQVDGGAVVVAGSLYLCGEVMRILNA
jgi:dihydrofolate synthase / folylpolyglutamate synthase